MSFLLELALQPPASAKQDGSCIDWGETEQPGDLLGGVPVAVVQDDARPLAFGQPLDQLHQRRVTQLRAVVKV
jgi:hypothetical protein